MANIPGITAALSRFLVLMSHPKKTDHRWKDSYWSTPYSVSHFQSDNLRRLKSCSVFFIALVWIPTFLAHISYLTSRGLRFTTWLAKSFQIFHSAGYRVRIAVTKQSICLKVSIRPPTKSRNIWTQPTQVGHKPLAGQVTRRKRRGLNQGDMRCLLVYQPQAEQPPLSTMPSQGLRFFTPPRMKTWSGMTLGGINEKHGSLAKLAVCFQKW